MIPKIDRPEGKQFTFEVFDDPDCQIRVTDPDRRSMATSGVVRTSSATMCRSRSTE